MKKFLFFLAIVIITTNLIQAQVNGFTLTDPYFPTTHELGDSFPLNVSFNWTPTTTSANITIDYDPALVNYDPSCTSSLPGCINIANNGSQLTITMSDLSACTNTNAISFNVCFQFICPDSCTGVTKSASFTAQITDNIPTTQTASCTSNGILTNKDLYVNLKLKMQQPTEKDIIRLDKIYYDYDKCDIKPMAAVELNRLIKLMNDYPDMIIELSSNTDSRSSDDYNIKLS